MLVAVLGSGAVAQPTPPSRSPEATPLFAPEDLASTLPSAIGDLGLDAVEVDFDSFGRATGEEGFWRSSLLSLGKGPEDLRIAGGMVVPATGLQPGDLPLTVWAFRIEGVPADAWAESYADAALAALDPGSRADYVSGWRVIDGRRVYAVAPSSEALAEMRETWASVPDDTGTWAYPVGEVLYWVGMPYGWPEEPPTIEDVLAGLP